MQVGETPKIRAFDVVEQQDATPKYLSDAGEAMMRLGGGMTAIGTVQAMVAQKQQIKAQKLQDEFDEAKAREADTQYQGFLTSTLNDPEKGFYTNQGESALKGLAPTREQISKRRKEISDGLPTEMSRKLFNRAADGHDLDTEARMQAHAAKELQVFKIEQAETSAVTNAQAAVDAYVFGNLGEDKKSDTPDDVPDDASKFEEKLGAAKAQIAAAGKMAGQPEEKIKLRQEALTSNAWEAVADKLIGQDPVRAQRLITARQKELGSKFDALQARVQGAASKSRGLDIGSQIIETSGYDLGKATIELENLRKSTNMDPDTYSHAQQQMFTLERSKRTAEAYEGAKLLDATMNSIIDNQITSPRDIDSKTAQKLKDLGVWDKAVTFIASGNQLVDTQEGLDAWKNLTPSQMRSMDDAAIFDKFYTKVSKRTFQAIKDMVDNVKKRGESIKSRDIEMDKYHAVDNGIFVAATNWEDPATKIKFLQARVEAAKYVQQLMDTASTTGKPISIADATKQAWEIVGRDKAPKDSKYNWERTAADRERDVGMQIIPTPAGNIMANEFSEKETKIASQELKERYGAGGYSDTDIIALAKAKKEKRVLEGQTAREVNPGYISWEQLEFQNGITKDMVLQGKNATGLLNLLDPDSLISADDIACENTRTYTVDGFEVSAGVYGKPDFGVYLKPETEHYKPVGISRASYERYVAELVKTMPKEYHQLLRASTEQEATKSYKEFLDSLQKSADDLNAKAFEKNMRRKYELQLIANQKALPTDPTWKGNELKLFVAQQAKDALRMMDEKQRDPNIIWWFIKGGSSLQKDNLKEQSKTIRAFYQSYANGEAK
jgi:hypothetical protein